MGRPRPLDCGKRKQEWGQDSYSEATDISKNSAALTVVGSYAPGGELGSNRDNCDGLAARSYHSSMSDKSPFEIVEQFQDALVSFSTRGRRVWWNRRPPFSSAQVWDFPGL